MQNTSANLKGTTFVILKSRASAPVRKKKSSPLNKPKRKASRNKLVEKSEVPNRVKSLGKIWPDP